MRPLNRPMFRYGGPIKEGIMSGIKEPRQNYNRAGKVLKYIPGGQNLVNKISTGTKDIIPRTIQRIKNFYSGDPSRYGVPAAEGLKQKTIRFLKPDEKAGVLTNKYLFDRTLVPAAGAVKYGVQKALPYATAGGLTIGGGTALYNSLKGDPAKDTDGDGISEINKKKRQIGMPENLTLGGGQNIPDIGERELSEEEKAAAVTDARKKQMDIYKEIMDIKGMKKDATYKALIDASQLITAEGDFKGSIKDGSLIAKLIGAADKRFDKVSDTETALRSLVAKGEIENQMNKETKALDKAYKQSALDINKKKLAGATLAEELSAYRTKNDKNASGRKLAGFLMDKNVNVIDIADTVKVDEHIKSGGDVVSFMESIVLKNLEKGTQVTPGIYVVKDAIIQIDENGNVTRARP